MRRKQNRMAAEAGPQHVVAVEPRAWIDERAVQRVDDLASLLEQIKDALDATLAAPHRLDRRARMDAVTALVRRLDAQTCELSNLLAFDDEIALRSGELDG